ncbi:DUF427 domain-containing protein [Methylorubrum extorquens]
MIETSQPPAYYLPPRGTRAGSLVATSGGSACEWKGRATYLDVVGPHRRAERNQQQR